MAEAMVNLAAVVADIDCAFQVVDFANALL